MPDRCRFRFAIRPPNIPPNPDDPFVDGPETPCNYNDAVVTETLQEGGLRITTEARVDVPAKYFGQVHHDDRVVLIERRGEVVANPPIYAVDGEPAPPDDVLTLKVNV